LWYVSGLLIFSFGVPILPGAVAAHLGYISRKGELTIETDEGDRVASRDAQKALLRDWHLELSAGQYRAPRDGRSTARGAKLVHNIVFSMPSPTPPEKVLAAARKFAREKFALQHRYAMVLHTDQPNPHVHMVVKAESEEGRRLHIDKALLRTWREDFAQLMREQGIAANATPRVARGRNAGKTPDAIYRAQRRGKSTRVRDRVTKIAKELMQTGTFHDPARTRLIETRLPSLTPGKKSPIRSTFKVRRCWLATFVPSHVAFQRFGQMTKSLPNSSRSIYGRKRRRIGDTSGPAESCGARRSPRSTQLCSGKRGQVSHSIVWVQW